MKKKFLYLILLLICVSCSSVNYDIDNKTYRANGKNNRIRFIVLHYTATNDEIGLRTLTKEQVSSHYLITSKDKDPIFNLVDEHERAWHAGVSDFNGRSNINDTSIGIEITNIGLENAKKSYQDHGFFVPYDEYTPYGEGQIKKVAHLLKELIKRYNIKATNIVGHSDVAPTRKIDPGAKFPWKRLYDEYGIGAWYDEGDKCIFMNPQNFESLSVQDIKREFRRYGYKMNNTDIWDEESCRVVYNFQAHFNPKDTTGNIDLETYAILMALNKKYR